MFFFFKLYKRSCNLGSSELCEIFLIERKQLLELELIRQDVFKYSKKNYMYLGDLKFWYENRFRGHLHSPTYQARNGRLQELSL